MLASLGGRLFEQAFAAENTPEDMRAYLAEHFTEAALQSVLRDPELHTLVLEDGATPVGWALLASGRSATRAAGGASTTTGGEVEIRRFYVDGRLHGSEAAPALLASALARARSLGAGTVWLAVWENNRRAQAFYRKHGFRRVGTQAFRLGADVQTDDVLLRPPSFGVSLAIVAGGGATRLGGVCKPLLRVRGRTVLDRLLALRTLADEVLLVSADPRIPDAGLRRVEDLLPARGAPGGVHAAMVQARAPWVLAVAGDMPFLDGRAVLPLLEARGDDVDAVAYTVAGRLEPLAALYRRDLAPRWAEGLARGGASFRMLWDAIRGVTLSESVLREVTGDARAVFSLNRPEDVATWVDAPPDPGS
ncbi:MAG: GNAT family N-acetyltransferase [Myxococcaceae bacterium]|nr:MAG: GNAT family N-acetyltransferase [Myxococcaceae bacterium]